MQPLQICIGPTILIGRESWCLPYAGFLNIHLNIHKKYRKFIHYEKLVSNKPLSKVSSLVML